MFRKIFGRRKKKLNKRDDECTSPRLSASTPSIHEVKDFAIPLSISEGPTTSRSEPPFSFRSNIDEVLPEVDNDPPLEEATATTTGSTLSMVAKPSSFRRQHGPVNHGEFISLKEVVGDYGLPQALIDLDEVKVLAYCEGYSHIYMGKYKERYVVLKVMPIENTKLHVSQCKRALHEIHIAQFLSDVRFNQQKGQGHIVKFVDFFPFYRTNTVVITTEFCRYGSLVLFSLCYRNQLRDSEKMQFAVDFTKGLSYMHTMQIAHRDFKMDNIMLTWSDEKERVVAKVGDFGVSASCLYTTHEASNVSSNRYMSPEIIRDRHHNPIYADLWAWAVSLYALFEGVYPFESHENSVRTGLTSIEYDDPIRMKKVTTFASLLDRYFTYTWHDRPALSATLNSAFFLRFPRQYIRVQNVDEMMKDRG